MAVAVGAGAGAAYAAYAALAITAVAAAAGGYAQYRSAQAAKAAASYQAKLADQNREIAEKEALDVLARGQDEEDKYRRRLALLRGGQIAQMASTGADLGGGSVLDILGDTAALGELDVQTIRQNTAREAYGRRVGAFGYGGQSRLYAAESANISPGLSGGVTLLGGASSFSDKWYSYSGSRQTA